MTWDDLTAEERQLVNRQRVRAVAPAADAAWGRAFGLEYCVRVDYLAAARAGAVAVAEYLRGRCERHSGRPA